MAATRQRSGLRRPRRDSSPGQVLVLFALGITVLFAAAGMAFDVGRFYSERRFLQNAADAAALAGASGMLPNTLGPGLGPSPDSALSRAKVTASLNRAYKNGPTPVIVKDADVVIDTGERTVKVTTRRDPADGPGEGVVTYFAKVFGIKQLLMTATATAKADPAGGVCNDVVPFAAIPQDSTGWTVGQVDTVQFSTDPNTGNFGLLDFSSLPNGSCEESPCKSNPGASPLPCEIETGLNCCLQENTDISIDTNPGAKVGPVRTGLKDRWDADDDHDTETYAQYLAKPNPSMKRVIVFPIIKNWAPTGRTTVHIDGFGAFFLRQAPDVNTATLYVEYVDVIRPGIADPNSTSSVYVLHLIQ